MRTSPLYALLQESTDYLRRQNVTGIDIISSKTSHFSFDSERGCDRFNVRIEYCGQNIDCQIIFDPVDWQFPPDVILPPPLDTAFTVYQVASDDWDIRDRTCLFKYMMQLRELFILEETKRLSTEHPDQLNDTTYSIPSSPDTSQLQAPYSETPVFTTPEPVSIHRQELMTALCDAFRKQLLECDTVQYKFMSLYVNVRIPEHIWKTLKTELHRLAEVKGVQVDKRMGQVATAVVNIQLSDEDTRSVDLNLISAINFQSPVSAEPKSTQINCSFAANIPVQEKVAHMKKTIIQQVPKLHASLPVQPTYNIDMDSP